MKRHLIFLLVLGAATVAHASGFEEFMASLSKLSGEERAARIDKVASEGTPLLNGNEVTFLVEERDAKEPTLLGGFNWWGRYRGAEGLVGGRMTRVPGANWYYLTTHFPSDARIEYGFSHVEGEAWTDPNNPRTISTFGRMHSVLEMPGYAPSPWLRSISDHTLGGRLESFVMQEDVVEGGRRIHVYLPPGYPDEAPYPAVYFNDGTAYVEELHTHAVLDRLIAKKAIRPVIGVFVPPVNRSIEYRGQREFLDFFANALVPRIDSRYKTLAKREGRAVIGGSRGARAALFLAWEPDPGFAFCGMLAPAFTPSDILARIFDEPTRAIEFHVVAGLFDVRFIGDAYQALDTLMVKGYSVHSSLEEIGHSPHSWKHFIPEMLIGFFPAGQTESD